MAGRAAWGWLSVVLALAAACSSGDDADVIPAKPSPETGCLDRPNELPRPPDGRLPCDLMPPGRTP